MRLVIQPSSRTNKKFVAVFSEDNDKPKRIHFGAKGMRDYLLMNDPQSRFYEPNKATREKVKQRYIARHRNDKLNDPMSAGALSMFLLWNKPTLRESLADFTTRFRLVV